LGKQEMVCITIPEGVIAFLEIFGIIFFFAFITFIVTIVGFREQISTNWEKYRCNPLFIPFAELFGHSSTESFKKCMFSTYKSSFAFTMPSILNLLGDISFSLTASGDMMTEMDSVLTGIQNMFTTGFTKILSQIGNTSSVVQYLIVKMEVLLQRLSATLVVVMYTLNASLQGVLAVKRDPTLLKAVDTLINFPSF
jgi:hypothetical protein